MLRNMKSSIKQQKHEQESYPKMLQLPTAWQVPPAEDC
jgi:hypothetical protein